MLTFTTIIFNCCGKIKNLSGTNKSIIINKYICLVDRVVFFLGLLTSKLQHDFRSDVAFVKVEIKMITDNIKSSLKTLSYHFDFYVGEEYMECLLGDFCNYNR